MRVIHVTPYFAPAFCYGGPPQSILGLCQGLVRAGVDVEVFTTTANGPETLRPAPDGTVHDGVPVRYFPLACPRRYWRAAGLRRALAAAARSADVVHVHGIWNYPEWVGVRSARAAGAPYVISPRGMLQRAARARHAASKALAFALLERAHLCGAAALHATSDEEAETLGVFGPPVATVSNGVSALEPAEADVERVRLAAGLSRDAEVVLFLGRIHPIKRLDLLARAFVRVRRAHPRAVLVIAGPDEGRHRRVIEPHLRDVAASVRWIDAVAGLDKWAWLAASRALVQCSDSESFGMSVAEALAAGTPVVLTDHGPWRELTRQACARIVPHDATALAAALADTLDGGAETARMAARGRAFAAQRFGWDQVARQMCDTYARAAGGARDAA